MKGVKVSLDTTVNENLYKGVSEFIATATGKPGHQFDIGYTKLIFDGDMLLKEGDYWTVSYYVDADNITCVDNPPSGSVIIEAGLGEGGSNLGWNKIPILFGSFPWGTYKHKRIVRTVKVNAAMVGASYGNTRIRCDNWATGSVRIYDIKVEKSDHATDYEE